MPNILNKTDNKGKKEKMLSKRTCQMRVCVLFNDMSQCHLNLKKIKKKIHIFLKVYYYICTKLNFKMTRSGK